MALRIGFVGAGMISEFHLKAWSRATGAEVVAVCDTDVARASSRARQFGISSVYPDIEEMIIRERVDAVDIATPLETHTDLVLKAASTGVAIMCQKPLAPTLREAQALAAAVADRSRLMVHENWRFRPYYRQIAEWMRRGELGQPVQTVMSATSSGMIAGPDGTRPALLREPSLRTSSHLAVGTLLIHHFDVLRFLLGPLRLRHATLRRQVEEVRAETMATLLLETANEAPVVVNGNMAAPGAPTYIRDELVLLGTAGSARLLDGHLQLNDRNGERRMQWTQAVAYQAAFDVVVQHFVDAITTGAPFESSIEDNLASVALVDEVLNNYPVTLANTPGGQDTGEGFVPDK